MISGKSPTSDSKFCPTEKESPYVLVPARHHTRTVCAARYLPPSLRLGCFLHSHSRPDTMHLALFGFMLLHKACSSLVSTRLQYCIVYGFAAASLEAELTCGAPAKQNSKDIHWNLHEGTIGCCPPLVSHATQSWAARR